jgi:two-component system, NarL family, response regulator
MARHDYFSAFWAVRGEHLHGGSAPHTRAMSAQAYLVKGMSHLKLLEAIRTVRSGQKYFPRSIRNIAPAKLNRSALSPRELDIRRLIVKRLNNQEIANTLNITRGTVKWHVNIIFRRLDVHDRTQAVAVAVQRGIVEIP